MKGVATESWHKKRAFHCFLGFQKKGIKTLQVSFDTKILFTTWPNYGYVRKKKNVIFWNAEHELIVQRPTRDTETPKAFYSYCI